MIYSAADPQFQPPNDNGQVANFSTVGLTEVSSAITAGEKTLLLLCMGQSNAAAWQGPSLRTFVNAKVHMINPADGRVYQAKEPLLGSDGGLGSMVSWVADKLITAGKCQRVIIGAGGAGGTTSAQHVPGNVSRYYSHISNIVSRFKNKGYLTNVDVVQKGMWIQGEADAQIPTVTQTIYQNNLLAIWTPIFNMGWTGKVCVSRTTWSSGALQSNSTAIRAAQANMPTLSSTMFIAGPDTDAYDNTNRRDTTHFNTAGQGYISDEYINTWIGPFV